MAETKRSTASSSSSQSPHFIFPPDDADASIEGPGEKTPSAIADSTLINIVVAGDRLAALHAVLTSIAKQKNSYLVYVWLLTSRLQNVDEAFTMAGDSFAGFSVISMKDVEDDLLEQGIKPIWFWSVYGSSEEKGWKRHGTMDLASWDGSEKHLSPFNHVRFYLPLLRWFRDLDRLIMLDDDVVIMKDLKALLKLKVERGVAIASTCEIWRWNNSMQAFKYSPGNTHLDTSASLYMTTKKHREQANGLFLPLIEKINKLGPDALRRQVDWNFGISLVDVRQWHYYNITEQYVGWMRANYEQHIVEERSLVFGLGIPQLALLGRHQCFPAPRFHVAEGLGFIKKSDVEKNDMSVDKFLRSAFALHYCGTKKPWNSFNDLDDEFRRPYLDLISETSFPIDDLALSEVPISTIRSLVNSSFVAMKRRRRRRPARRKQAQVSGRKRR